MAAGHIDHPNPALVHGHFGALHALWESPPPRLITLEINISNSSKAFENKLLEYLRRRGHCFMGATGLFPSKFPYVGLGTSGSGGFCEEGLKICHEIAFFRSYWRIHRFFLSLRGAEVSDAIPAHINRPQTPLADWKFASTTAPSTLYFASRNFCRNEAHRGVNMATFKVCVTVERGSISSGAALDLSCRVRSGAQATDQGFPLAWE